MKNTLPAARGRERVDWEVIRNAREECDSHETTRYSKKIFGHVKVPPNDYFRFGFIAIMATTAFMCTVLCTVVQGLALSD